MSDRLAREVERLAEGRYLSEFERSVVETVAGLTLRLADARAALAAEGVVVDDGKGFPVEHPMVKIEKQSSAELRGWVKDRPDLFGQRSRKTSEEAPKKTDKFGGFKLVK